MKIRLSLILVVLLSSMIWAINPPKKGKFPAGFWEIIDQNPDIVKYGDPGWVKRMETRKQLVLKMARGEIAFHKLAPAQFNLPILLGQFADSTGTFSTQDFQNLLFDNNSTGTMTQYYNEISYGQFTITGTVYGWFTADQGQAYYASNNNGLNSNYPQNAKGFVRNIVEKADATVDFSQFDNDGPDGIPNSGDDDGYVDAVGVVVAGAGPDWYPGNGNIWPHQSSLDNNEYTTNDASANGGNIKVNRFFVCPEEAGGGAGWGIIRPIGVFVHEFGHVLGLPDLYDRDGSSNGIGEWCLMASGSWGGDGSHTETPAHMSAWCKIQLGWITPTIISSDMNGLQIKQAETNPEAYLLWEDGYEWSRYFLIENRQKVGFDQYLNGDGLLIFHVDENQRWGQVAYSGGLVNNDELHKMVDLEEADGQADLDNQVNRGDAGDPYPGTSNNRSFMDSTTPNSRDYNGNSTGVAVTNISNSGTIMTADVKVRNRIGYTIAYDESGITGWGWGFQNPQDIWGGVLFQTAEAGTLKAVDIGFRTGPVTYELSVYSDFISNKPTGLLATVNGQVQSSGWYTVDIPGDSAVFTAGQTFFVALKVSGLAYGLSFDPYGPKSGRSYSSGDGITYSNNISTQGGDLNIRARIATQTVTAIKPQNSTVPNQFALLQNYPNPFNGGTVIRYQIPKPAKVRVTIYNIYGEKVAILVNEYQNAGEYQIHFQPETLSSGIYFYCLDAGNFHTVQKMILMK